MEVCIKRGKYTGEWLADRRHGEGISVSPEGHIFTGKWEFGVKQGRGTLQKSNGECIAGEWNKDQLVKTV